MKTITSFISIFTVIILIFSCTGPKGEDGFDGRDGIDGKNGVDGKDGRANVGAAIYDINPSDWAGNIDGFTTSFKVPEITQDVFENGAVLVYMIKDENTANQSFNQLPYTWLDNTFTEYLDFDAYIGSIKITLRWVDNGVNNTDAPTEKYTFKVIVIEGTPLSMLKSQTDITNPDAVIAYMSGNVSF
jgi:hypothetical protein